MNRFSALLNTKAVITYLAIVLITLVGLFSIQYFHIAYPLEVNTKQVSGELAVVGEGKVEIVPDKATLNAGITVNNAKTVEEARNQMSTIHNKIVEAVKKLGVDAKDMQTSSYSVNPNYSYEQGGSNTITGYNADASVTISVKEVAKVPQIIDAVTTAGANYVHNNGFSVENPEKYREQAREKAIQNGREQAQKLANTLGIRLGKVVNIVESSPNTSASPVMLRELAAPGGGVPDASLSVEPGTQTITSVVTLYFEKR